MKSKPGANVNNPMQKGKRRQKLHENQNNVGDSQNKPEFKDFNGNSIK